MKRYHFFLVLLFTLLTSGTCNRAITSSTQTTCYKGKLVIKGMCMNYVIQVISGDTAKLQLEKTWVDETTDETYNNVFALASKCSFPDLEEGSEFYFTVIGKDVATCNVCLAYRPVPTAKNNIAVSKSPCP
jgi:hypothetical protein